MLDAKLKKLNSIIRGMEKTIVAFSGGVDSSFLCKAVYDALGSGNVLAITFVSQVVPEREQDEAKSIAKHIGINHRIIQINLLHVTGFKDNPPNRCYICKKAIFKKLTAIADAEGFKTVVDGSNADDMGDYRPGMKALHELGVSSPFKEAGLSKAEIRELCKRLGIPGYDRPASACLASRIPYGCMITESKLRQIDKAEAFLRGLGFKRVRLRHHGDVARIEIDLDGFSNIIGVCDKVVRYLKELGFAYVALDLTGYRTGSLNETLEFNGYEY